MGELLAIVAAFGFAGSAVFLQKGVRSGGTPRQSMLIGNLVTLSAGLAGLAFQWLTGTVPVVTWTGVGAFALAGLCTSLMGRWLEVLSLEHISATYLTAMRMMDPAFSYVLAMLFLGDRLEWQPALGIVLVIGALNSVAFSQQRRPAAEPAPARVAAGGGEAGAGVAATAGGVAATAGGVAATAGGTRRLFFWGLSIALMASLAYSVGNIMRKTGLNHVPSPYVGVVIATAVAAALQGITAMIQPDRRPLTRLTLRDFIWSGAGAALGTVSFFAALNLVSVPVAVTLRNTSPWFAMLVSPLILKTRIGVNRKLVFSTVLFMIGVMLVVFR